MKKIALRTISCILLVAVFVSSMVFAQAEPELITEFIATTETNEYYNLEDGLYTKKTIKGPLYDKDGKEYYDVVLDTYTSDVTLISSINPVTIDLTFVVDMSTSVGSNERTKIRDAMKGVLSTLIEKHNVGIGQNEFKLNVAAIKFNDGADLSLDFTAVDSSSISLINKKIDNIGGLGGTDTGDALKLAYEKVSLRPKNNKQVIMLLTDGIPGVLPGVGVEVDNVNPIGNVIGGTNQTNLALKYANKLKEELDASVFTLGIGAAFKPEPSFNTNTNGLKLWIESDYKIRERQVGVLMNVWSSNWRQNKNVATNKKYYWGGLLETDETEWEEIYKDYYLAADAETDGYSAMVNSYDVFLSTISKFLIKEISTTYVCQGSLLKDFQIKDTVSDYFEIINTENEKPQFYKLSYIENEDGEYYKYIPNDSNNTYQYGANKRAFGSEEPLNNIVYNINGKTLSVTGFSDVSQVTDVFKIVDNNVVEGGEHTGNMFRIKYKIRPIDSHMGGRNVPIANEAQSGICKSNGTFVQNFDDLSVYNGVPTLKKDFAKFPVALVEGNYIANPENVKLGLIYDVKDLGKNGYYEFSGRHNKSNVYHYKHNDKGNMVVVKSDNPLVEIPYSCETVGYKFGNTSYNNFQLTELKEEAQTVLNTYTLFMSDYLTDEGYSGSSMADVAIESFDEWKATQTNSIVFANKDNPAANAGAKNGTFYYEGWQTAKTNSFAINLNVYIPIVLSNDIYINEKSTVLANPETLSVNVYSWAEDIDNDSLSEDHFGLFKLENGILKRVSSDANVTFAKDVLGLDKVSLNITAQVTECVDKDGNKKAATDKLTNGDKIKVELKYNELEKAISESDILNETENTFKTVFKDFYTYSLCSDCNEGDGADRQQYQVKVHSTSNSITVNKSGCDTNNLNDSFVFAVIGAEETSNGEIDLNTSEVISVFSIHGNGTQVVPVDTTKFKYFKVIEDTNAIANKAWTWNYNGLKINGEDILNGYNSKSSSEGFVKLSIGESVTFDFENNYNEDCSNYHYSSGYCTNILQAETDTYVKNSHDKIMSMN